MGMVPISQAPNWEEAMRAANMSGHATYIDSQQWVGDPHMGTLGLEDAHYGMPGLGIGADPTGQNAAQTFQQIIQTGLQTWQQIEMQKQANKQAAIAARQGRNPQGGGMTQGIGMPPDIGKWLLYAGIAIVVGIIIMSLLKKKKGSGGGGEHHEPAHKHTVIDEEVGI
jgi:hypothetical protein